MLGRSIWSDLSLKAGPRNMKPATIVGILLIILGVVGLAMGSISYSNQQNAANIGPLHIYKTEHHTIPIPPVLGAIALIGGIALVVAGSRKS